MANKLAYVFLVSVIAGACSPKKSEQNAAEAGAEEELKVAGLEFCTTEKAENCFLEIKTEGRSEFFAPESQMGFWLTKAGLSENGVNLTSVSDKDYQIKLASDAFPRATYDNAVKINLNVVDASGNVKVPGREMNVAPGKAGKLFSDLGKKFKRRPGQTSGKGSRIGFKVFFGTLGLGAVLPLFQSLWTAFEKNSRESGVKGVDILMEFDGETVTDHIGE